VERYFAHFRKPGYVKILIDAESDKEALEKTSCIGGIIRVDRIIPWNEGGKVIIFHDEDNPLSPTHRIFKQ